MHFKVQSLYVTFGAMVGILLGYDLGVIGGAISHVQRYFSLSNVQVEVLVGCFGIFQALGISVGAILADSVGRRAVLGISCLVATVGIILLTLASTFNVMLLGGWCQELELVPV